MIARGLVRRIALSALRALRPYFKLNHEQSLAWQMVIDMLEAL